MRKNAFLPFVQKENPDIICLQETKLGTESIDIDLPDYHIFYNSADKKGYSGTAILSKQEPLHVVNGYPEDFAKKFNFIDQETRDSAKEGRLITAEYEKFYVVCVYTPNSKDDLSRIPLRYKHWDPAFLAYCKQLETKKPVLFCGDLNVAHTPDDLARPKENEGKKGYTKEEREGFQNFINAGFIDTLRLFKKGPGYYTWWTFWANARARNIGWRIDYMLVSHSLKNNIKSADIHPDILGSDHCPVSVTLDI